MPDCKKRKKGMRKKGLPDRPLSQYGVSRSGDRLVRNFARRILKLENCERVGRVIIFANVPLLSWQWKYGLISTKPDPTRPCTIYNQMPIPRHSQIKKPYLSGLMCVANSIFFRLTLILDLLRMKWLHAFLWAHNSFGLMKARPTQ